MGFTEQFLDRINQFDRNGEVDINGLREYLLQSLSTSQSWCDFELTPPSGSYIKHTLQSSPIEVTVISWDKGGKSAIHLHSGFEGFVLVCRGRLDNVEYRLSDKELREHRTLRVSEGGMLFEKDGVIHKLQNTGDDVAISLHVYFPPLQTMEGMEIYDEQGNWAKLANKSTRATFDQEEDCYESKIMSRYNFVSQKNATRKSHSIFPIIPKPTSSEIKEMIMDYYEEQASKYDFFDHNHITRRLYTGKINELIAEDLKGHQPKEMLCLACGTGRRPAHIRELSGLPIEITGIDISQSMLDQAEGRGISTFKGELTDFESTQKYDAITMLYAFGHIPTQEERIQLLQSVGNHLDSNGRFYFDVFNVEDQLEWGPKALKAFNDHQLGDYKYDQGDIFYKKTDGSNISFLHYFSTSEIEKLLHSCGLEIERLKYIGYTRKSGEVVQGPNEGAIFVIAKKSRKQGS